MGTLGSRCPRFERGWVTFPFRDLAQGDGVVCRCTRKSKTWHAIAIRRSAMTNLDPTFPFGRPVPGGAVPNAVGTRNSCPVAR